MSLIFDENNIIFELNQLSYILTTQRTQIRTFPSKLKGGMSKLIQKFGKNINLLVKKDVFCVTQSGKFEKKLNFVIFVSSKRLQMLYFINK